MKEVKKAIIPIAGLGTRFLPLSKVLPKEFFPLVSLPVLQYIINEARESGIKEIIFVNRLEKKNIINYFKNDKNLEALLKKRNKKSLLNDLRKTENVSKELLLRQVFQREPLGASHAVYQAKKYIKNEPCAVLWADDVVETQTPCLLQLMKVFKKYQKPVIALCRVPRKSFGHYGMVKAENMGNRIFRIKMIAEKPSPEKSPSNLAIVGKYIITPEVFKELDKTSFSLKTDISLSDVLGKMAEEGKDVYGYEFEGSWLECGNKLAYFKSNLYLSLKDPQFGKELRDYLKEII